jgi:hypothetical protein
VCLHLFILLLFTTTSGPIHPFNAIPCDANASPTTLPDMLAHYKMHINEQLVAGETRDSGRIQTAFT